MAIGRLAQAVFKTTVVSPVAAVGSVVASQFDPRPTIQQMFRLSIVGPIIQNISSEFQKLSAQKDREKQEDEQQTKQVEKQTDNIVKIEDQLNKLNQSVKSITKILAAQMSSRDQLIKAKQFRDEEEANERVRTEDKPSTTTILESKDQRGLGGAIFDFFKSAPFLSTLIAGILGKIVWDNLPEETREATRQIFKQLIDRITDGLKPAIDTLKGGIDTAIDALLILGTIKATNVLADMINDYNRRKQGGPGGAVPDEKGKGGPGASMGGKTDKVPKPAPKSIEDMRDPKIKGKKGSAGGFRHPATGKIISEEAAKALVKESAKKMMVPALTKIAGQAVPGISWIVGGYFALQQALEGDYVGAGVTAIGSVAGIVTAVAATVTNVARYVYRDVYGRFPEEDVYYFGKELVEERVAFVTEACRKIAEDWMKEKGYMKEATEVAKPAPAATAPVPVTPEAVAERSVSPPSPSGTGGPTSPGVQPTASESTPIPKAEPVENVASSAIPAAAAQPQSRSLMGGLANLLSGGEAGAKMAEAMAKIGAALSLNPDQLIEQAQKGKQVGQMSQEVKIAKETKVSSAPAVITTGVTSKVIGQQQKAPFIVSPIADTSDIDAKTYYQHDLIRFT